MIATQALAAELTKPTRPAGFPDDKLDFAACSVKVYLTNEQRWIEALLDTGAAQTAPR